jgi:hypothetical protein
MVTHKNSTLTGKWRGSPPPLDLFEPKPVKLATNAVEGDEIFFLQNPARCYRLRFATKGEIEAIRLRVGDGLHCLPGDQRWVTVVAVLAPNTRMRKFLIVQASTLSIDAEADEQTARNYFNKALDADPASKYVAQAIADITNNKHTKQRARKQSMATSTSNKSNGAGQHYGHIHDAQ